MLAILQTDRSIIRNVLRGRTDRFGVLVDRYGRLVYAIAYAYLRNPQDAEDVVQESYTRLYQRLDTFSWEQNIGPWLAQVARNVAVDRLRKRGREVLMADPPPAGIAHLPNPARDEMRQLVAEQLGHLDTADREVLLLHYFLGKKAREIAALLDIQPAAAAKRLQRARDELGRRLVDVVKEDLIEDRAEPARRRRIMSAIAVTAIPWKPSAAAAATVSVITGASATKSLLIVAAGIAVVFAGLFVGLKLWFPGLPSQPRAIQTTSQYIANAPPAPLVATTATANDAAKANTEPAPAPKPDAPAAAEHGPGRPISGIVVTEQGQPVPGAKVTVDNFAIAARHKRASKNDITIEPPTPLAFSTVTGQDGTFSFASFPFILEKSYNKISVSAEADDMSGETSVYCTPDLIDEFIQITVRREATLAGIVTDAAGVPIEDALLFPKDVRKTDVEVPAWPSSCWTEPDGTFVIKHVMRGEFNFEVAASGYACISTDWFPSGKTDIVIKLGGRNSISGRVTENATGIPVVDGNVVAKWEGSYGRDRTDAEGKFTVEGLTPGKVEVKFVTRGNPPCPYILPEPVVVTVVEGRPVTGLEIKVFRGAVLSGQVSDAASGAPLQDAVISVKTSKVSSDNPFPHQMVKTNADGHYDAPGLPPGDLELVAQAKDYAEKSIKVHIGDYGQTQRVDVRMELMPAVNGSVVATTGAPVAGASVVAVYSADNTGPWPDPAITDAAGNFRLNLPKNVSVRLQAWGQGEISPISGAVAPGARGVVLRLAGGGIIEGTVVDAAGAMVGGARVSIMPVDEDAQEILRFAFTYDNRENKQSRTLQDGPGATCSTDGGFFRSGLLQAGYYDLNMMLAGRPMGSTRVLVRAGQTLQTRLQIDSGDSGVIEGRVTANGLPRGGLMLCAGGNCAKTDEDGRYRISPVSTGSVTVILFIQDVRRGEQTADVVQGETSTVDFDLLVADTVVEGIVRMNGQPLAQAVVTLYPANNEDPQSRVTLSTDAEGAFRAQDLPEGLYRCEVVPVLRVLSRPEFVSRETREISLASGSTTRADFDFAGAAIESMVTGVRKGERGMVCLLTGDAEIPEISEAVMATLAQKLVAGESLSADGVVRFFGIAPGPYVVAVVAIPAGSPDDDVTMLESALAGRYAAAQVDAPGGEVVHVELPLP